MGVARVMPEVTSSRATLDRGSTSGDKLVGMSAEVSENGKPRPDGVSASPRGVKRQRQHQGANGDVTDQVAMPIDGAAQAGASRDEVVCSDDWHRQYEELQRERPPRLRASLPTDKLMPPPGEAELLSLARRACRNGTEANWEALTFPSKLPRTQAVSAVARQLSGPEAAAVLKTCAARFRLYPRERSLCAVWILQVIENRGSILVGRRELTEALRDLLQHLEPRPGEQPLTSRVIACLGKWRLVGRLRKRRSEPAPVATSSRASASNAAAAEETSSDEDGEDDSQEDGVVPAAGDESDD